MANTYSGGVDVSILPCSPSVESKPLPKAVGYVRVSTSDLAENGVSLEAQQSRIGAWRTANGYELAAVHADAGLSGSRADNRPELQRALRAASKARGRVLVVYSLSRLARRLRSHQDLVPVAARAKRTTGDQESWSFLDCRSRRRTDEPFTARVRSTAFVFAAGPH